MTCSRTCNHFIISVHLQTVNYLFIFSYSSSNNEKKESDDKKPDLDSVTENLPTQFILQSALCSSW